MPRCNPAGRWELTERGAAPPPAVGGDGLRLHSLAGAERQACPPLRGSARCMSDVDGAELSEQQLSVNLGIRALETVRDDP